MKIGIFVPTLRFGGGERVAANLINGLVKYENLDVKVFLYDKKQVNYKIDDRVEIISIEEPTDIVSIVKKPVAFINKARKIKSVINEYNIDVVISVMTSMNILTLLANTNAKVIITEHNVIREERKFSYKIMLLMMKHLYKKANKIIAVSDGVKNSLKGLVSDLDVSVIYNPLDITEIKNMSLENIESQYGNYILGVGRLTKQKGFDILIKAFSKIDNKNIRLLLLGDGEEKENLESLVKEFSLKERVTFLGFQDNPYKYMKNSACFVLSSRWEGFGLVLTEAMASGAKVVSFNCKSGPSEILDNGEIGYLAKAENIDDLARNIELCLHDNNTNNSKIEKKLKDFETTYILNKYYNIIVE